MALGAICLVVTTALIGPPGLIFRGVPILKYPHGRIEKNGRLTRPLLARPLVEIGAFTHKKLLPPGLINRMDALKLFRTWAYNLGGLIDGPGGVFQLMRYVRWERRG